MSLIRPTLRPVDWSEIDHKGRHKRFDSSDSSDDDHDDYYTVFRRKTKMILHTSMYYPPPLSPSERIWRDRYGLLIQRGYQLRPRYQPHWTPTTLGGKGHTTAEDHIMQILPQVLDAIRRQDGLVVCIRMIQLEKHQKMTQIKILDYFSSRRMTGDTRNHVVPLFDNFTDSYTPWVQFIVTPVLRRFDDPEFVAPCEIVDFISQALEGLAFLHKNHVAHHNLIAEHIMMDAKAIVPTGWHFVSHFCEPDGITKISPLERRNYPVRYYFVGFGKAFHSPFQNQQLLAEIGGGDVDVPELRQGIPYDPFKLDIYTLGNVFKHELYEKYDGLDFIHDLLQHMHVQTFSLRPTAEKVLHEWYNIRRRLNEDVLENSYLTYKNGSKKESDSSLSTSPSGSFISSTSTSMSTRSDKRDISSILNKEY